MRLKFILKNKKNWVFLLSKKIPDYDYLNVFLNHLMSYLNDVDDVFDDEMEVDDYYPFQ
jgi:hypothetical protein